MQRQRWLRLPVLAKNQYRTRDRGTRLLRAVFSMLNFEKYSFFRFESLLNHCRLLSIPQLSPYLLGREQSCKVSRSGWEPSPRPSSYPNSGSCPCGPRQGVCEGYFVPVRWMPAGINRARLRPLPARTSRSVHHSFAFEYGKLAAAVARVSLSRIYPAQVALA